MVKTHNKEFLKKLSKKSVVNLKVLDNYEDFLSKVGDCLILSDIDAPLSSDILRGLVDTMAILERSAAITKLGFYKFELICGVNGKNFRGEFKKRIEDHELHQRCIDSLKEFMKFNYTVANASRDSFMSSFDRDKYNLTIPNNDKINNYFKDILEQVTSVDNLDDIEVIILTQLGISSAIADMTADHASDLIDWDIDFADADNFKMFLFFLGQLKDLEDELLSSKHQDQIQAPLDLFDDLVVLDGSSKLH